VERLSHWRVAAWVALCLSGIAVVAALLLPALFRSQPKRTARVVQATLTPRTHLFGQPVVATLEVPAGSAFRARFTPYRVVRRTIVRKGASARYEFTLQCLRSVCAGLPGTEREVPLPAVHIRLPNGKRFVGYWPPLRVASRLGPSDLAQPVPRGNAVVPDSGRANRALGVGLAAGAALALLAAGLLGVLWLAPRPLRFGLAGRNGHAGLSDLDYALVVTGLAAGGGPDDRRAALESLAVALDERGEGDLAAEARRIAWSPLQPRGDALRRLATTVQELTRKDA
jgi:hypothetical protein